MVETGPLDLGECEGAEKMPHGSSCPLQCGDGFVPAYPEVEDWKNITCSYGLWPDGVREPENVCEEGEEEEGQSGFFFLGIHSFLSCV